MRFFNTAGPIKPAKHYCIPPLERLDLDDVLGLIRDEKYFVLHAPRQTGKTSALLTLRDLLNAEDAYRCVYVNVEGGQAMREDVEQVMRVVLGRVGTPGEFDAGRCVSGRDLARHLDQERAGCCVARGLDAMVQCGSETAGVAHRRDRRANWRFAPVRVAAVARRLRPTSRVFSAKRGPVRDTRCARLPHPFRFCQCRHCRWERV